MSAPGSPVKGRSDWLGWLRWALDQRSGDAGANHLLIRMAVFANTSGMCYASQETLSRAIECDERTVSRRLKVLIERSLIEDVSHEHPSRKTKTYRLLMKKV